MEDAVAGEEAFDGDVVVEAVAGRARHAGAGVDRWGAASDERLAVAALGLGRRADGAAVGAAEGDALSVAVGGVAAFVQQAVVVAAEQQQVGERGVAAVGPVVDVVGVDEAALGAAGELAAVVAAV